MMRTTRQSPPTLKPSKSPPPRSYSAAIAFEAVTAASASSHANLTTSAAPPTPLYVPGLPGGRPGGDRGNAYQAASPREYGNCEIVDTSQPWPCEKAFQECQRETVGKTHQRLYLLASKQPLRRFGERKMAATDTRSPSQVMSLWAAGLVLMVAMLGHALLSAPTSHASVYQDQEFYRLLTDPDQDDPLVIWNFPGVRSQGIAVCQREDAGEAPYDALLDLTKRRGGPYTFDDANNISSSAKVVYCPWHGSWPDAPGGPQGVTESRPISPRPVYPPLMWSPPVWSPPPAPPRPGL